VYVVSDMISCRYKIIILNLHQSIRYWDIERLKVHVISDTPEGQYNISILNPSEYRT
jgi:hypothetical protein